MFMVEFALGISLASGVLFLVLLTSYILNLEKAKIFLSCITSGFALLSMILFCYIQKANCNPDQGMEFQQWYFPILIYLFLIVFGVVSFITTIIKTIIKKVKSK